MRVGVRHRVLSSPDWVRPCPSPSACASPALPVHSITNLPSFFAFVCHSLHRELAVSCPHLGRHYYFANKTCPACPARWVVWRDFLQTAVLIVAQDSCKLQSQRVALPAREEPCPLHDLCLIIPAVHLGVPRSFTPRALSCHPQDGPGRAKPAPFGGAKGQTDIAKWDVLCSCLSPHWPLADSCAYPPSAPLKAKACNVPELQRGQLRQQVNKHGESRGFLSCSFLEASLNDIMLIPQLQLNMCFWGSTSDNVSHRFPLPAPSCICLWPGGLSLSLSLSLPLSLSGHSLSWL